MSKPTPYALAMEVDRSLKLNLSNGRFDALAIFIDSHEDGRKIANELMTKSSHYVIGLIETVRAK